MGLLPFHVLDEADLSSLRSSTQCTRGSGCFTKIRQFDHLSLTTRSRCKVDIDFVVTLFRDSSLAASKREEATSSLVERSRDRDSCQMDGELCTDTEQSVLKVPLLLIARSTFFTISPFSLKSQRVWPLANVWSIGTTCHEIGKCRP